MAALVSLAQAAELQVMAPNAVKEAVTEIAGRYERESGQAVRITWGGSEAIARRIADGGVVDVVIHTAQGVDRMASEGRLVAGGRTDVCRSAVAVAVRAGLPRPDITSVDGLKAALLEARTIAISSGASGRYLEQLFQRLGVAEAIRPKLRQPPSGAQISEMLARGEADLGFQQKPELLHAPGIQYLGPLPAEVQNDTVWAAGTHRQAAQPDAARAFIRALAAPASAAAIRQAGMDPL